MFYARGVVLAKDVAYPLKFISHPNFNQRKRLRTWEKTGDPHWKQEKFNKGK